MCSLCAHLSQPNAVFRCHFGSGSKPKVLWLAGTRSKPDQPSVVVARLDTGLPRIPRREINTIIVTSSVLIAPWILCVSRQGNNVHDLI